MKCLIFLFVLFGCAHTAPPIIYTQDGSVSPTMEEVCERLPPDGPCSLACDLELLHYNYSVEGECVSFTCPGSSMIAFVEVCDGDFPSSYVELKAQ
jgi:hypothetical protein